MQAKAVKALGVLLLMGGLSYGVYEGIKISPTSYMYNSISDVSLLENVDAEPLTINESDIYTQKNENLIDNIKFESEPATIVNPSDQASTSVQPPSPQKTSAPEPVVSPENGMNTVATTIHESNGTTVSTVPSPEIVESPKVDQKQPAKTISSVVNDTAPNVPKASEDQTASSHGLKKAENYDAAAKDDKFTDNDSSASKPTTFVEGENPEYIKELWTSSIAIKHRQYWNLSPIGDQSWEKQVALVRKRFSVHAYENDKDIIYGMVFGDFTINESKASEEDFDYKNYRGGRQIYMLNAKNLANICYYNLARTPSGVWWSLGRYRWWALLWDFCSKESVRNDGTPSNYWYHNKGDRKEERFNKLLSEASK